MAKIGNLLSEKIQDYILDYIASRNLRTGDRLPSERDIGKVFKASQIPVRQAMQKIIKMGIVEQVPYKGTFVKNSIEEKKETVTNRLGVLYWPDDLSFFKSSFYSTLLASITSEAESRNKSLLLRSMRMGNQIHPIQILKDLDSQVDGFIIADLVGPIYEVINDTLTGLAKPVVILVYADAHQSFDSILMDNKTDTIDMMEYLISLGHRKIGCVYHKNSYDTKVGTNIQERIDTYFKVVREKDLGFIPSFEFCIQLPLQSVSNGDSELYTWLNNLINSDNRPTALFCVNDDVALWVYQVAEQLDIAIPDDLTIVGSGNFDSAKTAHPPLTTTSVAIEEIGRAGVKRLYEKIEEQSSGRSSVQKVLVAGKLVKRESHKNISNLY